MKKASCVVAVIISGASVLTERRASDDDTDAGALALPGGHVEASESLADALKRECLEELSIEPVRAKAFCCLKHPTPNEVQDCHYYLVTEWKGSLKTSERLAWLPLNQSSKLDLPADRTALEKLAECGALACFK